MIVAQQIDQSYMKPIVNLTPWTLDHQCALVTLVDNPNVVKTLSDRFPHPYTIEIARAWLATASTVGRLQTWAITENGSLAGGISLTRREGAQKHSAGIAYWLGEPFWGRGVATQAVSQLLSLAFEDTTLVRIDTTVLAWNAASARVLEKNGFLQEGINRNGILKDGRLVDRLVYARISDANLVDTHCKGG